MPPKIDIKLDKELCDLICDIAVAFDCQREIDGKMDNIEFFYDIFQY